MAVSKEDILETISNMTVMEVVELVKAMEDKFGVSAAIGDPGRWTRVNGTALRPMK